MHVNHIKTQDMLFFFYLFLHIFVNIVVNVNIVNEQHTWEALWKIIFPDPTLCQLSQIHGETAQESFLNSLLRF